MENKIKGTHSRIIKSTIALVILFVALTLAINSASAATIDVGSGAGNNSTTIQGGINLASVNDTIIVHSNPGNYSENVSVNKVGLTIKSGTGENVTVQSTGGTVFTVSGANSVTISGFTIKGSSPTSGVGIALTNANYCNILNNYINSNWKGLTVTGSNNTIFNNTFYNNQYGIMLNYPSHNNTISNNNISNPSYTPNSQYREGISEHYQYDPFGGNKYNQNNKYLNNNISSVNRGFFIEQGTNFTISGNIVTIEDSYNYAHGIFTQLGNIANQVNVISNNTVNSKGKVNAGSNGIRLQTNPASPLNTNLQIYSNSITNFTDGIYSVLYTPTGSSQVQISFNRFYNNTHGLSLSSSNTVFNAVNNWWGKNGGLVVSTAASAPASYDIWYSTGTVTYNPWLVLTASGPTNLAPGSSSIITADLQHDSNGVYHNPVNGHVPDGIPVNFAGDALGITNPLSSTMSNGFATTNFTAGPTTGTSNPTVTVDGVTVPVSINIANVIPTSLIVNPISSYQGDAVNLIATLTDTQNNVPVSGKTVSFTVNGSSVGSATTDASGAATLPYTISLGIGTYQILAQFLGDASYSGSAGTNSLTVNPIPTQLVVDAVNGFKGYPVNLIATLTDTAHSVPVSGKTVKFTVNGVSVGSAVTNASGVATLPYTVTLNAGTYQILAEFVGDTVYAASNGVNNLVVNLIPTSLTVPSVSTYHGDQVSLTATLTDTAHGVPVSGKTINFSVDGVSVGSAVTNASGIATLPYTVTLNAGTYQILAEFLGDTAYDVSSAVNNLNVNYIPTNIVVTPVSSYHNDIVNLIATLTDTHNNVPVSGKTVNFSVDGVSVGSATTDTSGAATLQYTIPLAAGTYQILAEFVGDNIYAASNGVNNMVINLIPTNLAVAPISGYYNDAVNLIATLTDTHNNVPLAGQQVDFSVDGVSVGSATTDASGVATLPYTITQGAGVYQILAQFAQDTIYAGITGTDSLTVSYIPTSIVIAPITGYYGDLTALTATLTDLHNNIPVSGKTVDFTVDGVSAGSATTDASGVATLPYTIGLTTGTYQILAEFLGDTAYTGSADINNLIVNHIPTNIIINPLSGNVGDAVNLVATLTDLHNNIPLAGQQVDFLVNGVSVGSAVTNASGVATLPYVLNAGTYMVQFLGDNIYSGSTGTTVPNVLVPTQIAVNAVNGLKGSIASLTATLTGTNNAPLSGKTVNFSVNGSSAGSAVTNASGVASIPYTVTLNAGIYAILAQFAGDIVNTASSGTNNLTVPDTIAPTITVNPVGGLSNTNKIVTLITTDPDSTATTYYTRDGSDPKTSATRSIYSGSITISTTTTLKFAAVDPAGLWSPVYTQTYTIDKIAPKVVSTNPRNGATGVSRTSTIAIKFSKNIKASINWSKVYVKNLRTGKLVSISKWISGNTLYIKTTSRRYAYYWYQVYIPTGAVKDSAGNYNLGYRFGFKTGRY